MNESPYHEGELEVQTRADVREMAARVGKSIGREMPPKAQEFLAAQPFVLVGSAAPDGSVWASLLCGNANFARALDARTLQIHALPLPSDPLWRTLHHQVAAPIGLLAIEPSTRRRMRINGLASLEGGGLHIRAQEVYANCSKYIQKREWRLASSFNAPVAQEFAVLTDEQQQWVEKADTFFIATLHRARGADVSHRGGEPGFVRVKSPTRLHFPDYAGNAMFNTLGNLAINPRASLLFIEWKSGATLQLCGEARVLWTQENGCFAGAERVVEFDIEGIIYTAHASPLRWDLLEASPFNPKDNLETEHVS